MASSPNTKGLPMHKAMAMGLNPKVSSAPKAPATPSANNFFPKVSTGATSVPNANSPSAKLPSTMPSALQTKIPKGLK